MKKIRVLIADKQALAVAGIEHLLEEEVTYEISGIVTRRDELHYHILHHSPDLLVIDYANVSNFSSDDCVSLQKQYPALKFFILTTLTDREQILKVIQSGVFAFLTKDCSHKEILNAFRAICEGQKFYCNSVLDMLTEQNQPTDPDQASAAALSSRELQIVKCIAQDLSTHDIAAELNLSPHTINAHRKRILKKLDAKSPVGLVMKALRLHLIPLNETSC
uniref:Response regulator transcription factor n=1 Tax=Roseihalotalea indica TaxID=2867963 RepID=A0AA49GJQ2_9BACT|nr:response regulator transcription factor [Tunicatimonas sp. TK19036]